MCEKKGPLLCTVDDPDFRVMTRFTSDIEPPIRIP